MRFFFTFIALLLVGTLSAKHIVGGEVTYECLGEADNGEVRYRVKFYLYRDCGPATGAEFDNVPNVDGQILQFTYTIFRDGEIFRGTSSTIGQEDLIVDPISLNFNNPCLEIPPNLCVERGVYTTEITLPRSTESYTISYQRCCRTDFIANIVDPQNTGATYLATISPEAQQSCNSSPTFTKFPPLVICNNFPVTFDHSATDADGDSLVYRFSDPYVGGGNIQSPPGNRSFDGVAPDPESPPPYAPVTFNQQFTAENPLAGSDPISIDATTGLISGIPEALGQYVVCVTVEEYRDGELLGETRRDFQFNVVSCDQSVFARAAAGDEADSISSDLILVCGDTALTVVDESGRREFIETVAWTFFGTSEGDVTSDESSVRVGYPGYGTYPAQLIANPGLVCTDTAEFNIVLAPPIEAEFDYTFDTCVYGPIAFRDITTLGTNSVSSRVWDFGDGGTSTEENPTYLYDQAGERDIVLELRDDNNCVSRDSAEIAYFPAPRSLDIDANSDGLCAPALVEFGQRDSLLSSDYTVFWDFGNGDSSDELNPSYTYAEPGSYSVFFSAESRYGCFADTQLNDPLVVQPRPEAGFSFVPTELTVLEPTVNFTDESQLAAAWSWQFDSLGTSRATDPSFTFPDSGSYRIDQLVAHRNGCIDTATQFLRVAPYFSYAVPNAFTPNGDGNNERFLGAGYTRYLQEFELQVFNRWGEKVFETSDVLEGWDGYSQRNGGLAPPGAYLYIVNYTALDGPQQLTGYLTLLQ